MLTGDPEAFAKTCDTELAAVKDLITDMRSASSPLEVLEKFDTASRRLTNMGSRAALAKEVHPDVKFREIAEVCQQRLETYTTSLSQDRGVYDALSKVDGSAFDPVTVH